MVAKANFNLQELNNLYGRLDGLSGGNLSQLTSYGDIAWFKEALGFGSDVERVAQGDASAFKNIIDKILNIVEKIGCQEANNARREVGDTATKAQELNQKSQELGVQMEGEFSEVAASIENQSEIVTDASALLEEANQQIQEHQQKIQEIISKITEAQASLASETDPNKQAEILAEIQGYAGEISTCTALVISQQAVIESLQAAVDDATSNIADATEQMTVVVTDGQAKIGQLATEAAQATGDVAETAVEGTSNAANASALQTAAASSGVTNVLTLGATATATVQLERTAADQGTASTTRLASIGANSGRIASGIDELQNSAQIMTDYTSTVGSAIENFTNLVGSWDTTVPSVIKSIGTATNIETENTQLKEIIPIDLEKIGVNPEEVATDDGNRGACRPDNLRTGESQQSSEIELKTPKFRFTHSFGI